MRRSDHLIQVDLIVRVYSSRLSEIPEGADELSFGNDVYKVKFDDRDMTPRYGHRYTFFLQDAVEEVPEYVVYWDEFLVFVPPQLS